MNAQSDDVLDVIIVGSGFAGMYALHLLRSRGFRCKVLEAGTGVGGTWFWNRYPGARCDAQSLVYSFSFDASLRREWKWSEHYATQPEILAYLNFVADRLDLRKDTIFGARVTQALFDDLNCQWTVEAGDGHFASARFMIIATGPLSAGHVPQIPGLEDFEGRILHTGTWPDENVGFTGKKVAVVGTGSSGVQVIPVIAREAAQLTVFQRTPPFVLPARSKSITSEEFDSFIGRLDDYREGARQGEVVGIGDVLLSDHLPPPQYNALSLPEDERHRLMQARWEVGGVNVWRTFAEIASDSATNDIVAEFVRNKIREVVKDPALAERLTPKGFPFGAKRPCVGTDYYETFNRSNVRLVDISASPIERIGPAELWVGGEAHHADIIVFATGFDALTGALTKIDVVGSAGRTIQNVWKDGAEAYLGVAINGFPNMFTVCGPGSPSVLGNVVVNIEQNVEWISDLLSYARSNSISRAEAGSEAQRQWAIQVDEAASRLLTSRANSWYLGANIPGKARRYLPYPLGIRNYRATCDEIAAAAYRGFAFATDCSEGAGKPARNNTSGNSAQRR